MCGNWLSGLRHHTRKRTKKQQEGTPRHHRTRSHGEENLSEIAVPPPIENPDDAPLYRHHTLEEVLSHQSDDHGRDEEMEGERVQRRKSLEEAFERIKKDEEG